MSERTGAYLLLVFVLALCGFSIGTGRWQACAENAIGGVPETHWHEGAPAP